MKETFLVLMFSSTLSMGKHDWFLRYSFKGSYKAFGDGLALLFFEVVGLPVARYAALAVRKHNLTSRACDFAVEGV